MNKKAKNTLNRVNMNLLLEILNPKRKDIIVTRTGNPKKIIWRVTNNQGAEIFSLQNEEVKYEDGFYDEYERVFTLKINGVNIISEDQDFETESFITNKLQNALTTKIDAQIEEAKMRSAIKNMSAQDIMIKKHLEKMLQR